MSRFFLVRHGAHDALGRVLVGRSAGVHLNALGERQAEWLGLELAKERVTALFSSPLERSMETAKIIASRLGLAVTLAPEFNEMDFGLWSNRSFRQLESDPNWARFNAFRSLAYPPGGETMLQAQQRAVARMEELRRAMPKDSLAVVSHADPIKGVIAHFLGVPLDLLHRIEISPGSLSVLSVTEEQICVERLNVTLNGLSR